MKLVHGGNQPILNMARDIRISKERSQLVLVRPDGSVYEPQASAFHALRVKRVLERVAALQKKED